MMYVLDECASMVFVLGGLFGVCVKCISMVYVLGVCHYGACVRCMCRFMWQYVDVVGVWANMVYVLGECVRCMW